MKSKKKKNQTNKIFCNILNTFSLLFLFKQSLNLMFPGKHTLHGQKYVYTWPITAELQI